MIFKEMSLAYNYCIGKGLEIGAAAHNPFGLDTINVDLEASTFYQDEQVKLCGIYTKVDIQAPAWDIPLEDSSQDFIISSHVVEHLPCTIKTFIEWDRLLKVGGICFIIHPLPNALPADCGRPITTLEHYIEDFDKKLDLDTHSTERVPGGKCGHYHVANLTSFLKLIMFINQEKYVKWRLVDTEDVDSKVGNGFTVVLRKYV